MTRRAVGLGLAGSMLAASVVAARQGVSSFGEATPVGSSESATGWRVADALPLELEGIPCSLSPDGQWLAGIGTDRELSLWRLPDLEQTLVPFHEAIDPDSFAWSPDGTAVAFSLLSFMLGIDGDIFVYELADETIHNVTDDGYEGGLLFSDEDNEYPIDVMPVWTPDSSAIVFARSVRENEDSITTDIARVARSGGEVEVLHSTSARPFSIYTPMEMLPDGTVIYTFAFADVDDEMNGIWKLDPDGNTELLMPGAGADAFPIPVVLDVWADESELRIAGISAALSGSNDVARPWVFTWSSETPVAEPVENPDAGEAVSLQGAFWSPDGGTLLLVGSVDSTSFIATSGPASDVVELPAVEMNASRGPRWIRPIWSAQNTLLISGVTGASCLVTMEPAGSS